MEKLVGTIVSKTSKIRYPVQWHTIDKTVWIDIAEIIPQKGFLKNTCWYFVCNAETEDTVLLDAQKIIDSQPDLY